MIEVLVAGQRDPEVLAEMAKGRMRAKIIARVDRTACWPCRAEAMGMA